MSLATQSMLQLCLVYPRCKFRGKSSSRIFIQHNLPMGSAKSDCPGFNLMLDVTHVLPLVFKDVPSGMFDRFNDLLFSNLNLPTYGFYTHSDIQSLITNCREGDACDTAKVCLWESEVTNQHKVQWHTLHQDIFKKNLVGSDY